MAKSKAKLVDYRFIENEVRNYVTSNNSLVLGVSENALYQIYFKENTVMQSKIPSIINSRKYPFLWNNLTKENILVIEKSKQTEFSFRVKIMTFDKNFLKRKKSLEDCWDNFTTILETTNYDLCTCFQDLEKKLEYSKQKKIKEFLDLYNEAREKINQHFKLGHTLEIAYEDNKSRWFLGKNLINFDTHISFVSQVLHPKLTQVLENYCLHVNKIGNQFYLNLVKKNELDDSEINVETIKNGDLFEAINELEFQLSQNRSKIR